MTTDKPNWFKSNIALLSSTITIIVTVILLFVTAERRMVGLEYRQIVADERLADMKIIMQTLSTAQVVNSQTQAVMAQIIKDVQDRHSREDSKGK